MAASGKDILAASPPKISRDSILSDYPLHWHVWHKDASSLEEELALNKVGVLRAMQRFLTTRQVCIRFARQNQRIYRVFVVFM